MFTVWINGDMMEISSMAVYGMTGKKLDEFKPMNQKMQVDLSKFGKGVFLIKTNMQNGQVHLDKVLVR